MSHLILAFWRWGLRNCQRSFAHEAEWDTTSLWDRGLISGSPPVCSYRDHHQGVCCSPAEDFLLLPVSSDSVGNSPGLWILQSQTDQRSPRWRCWAVSLLQANYSFTGDSTQGSCWAGLLAAWWRLLKGHRPISWKRILWRCCLKRAVNR